MMLNDCKYQCAIIFANGLKNSIDDIFNEIISERIADGSISLFELRHPFTESGALLQLKDTLGILYATKQ